jgi:hypothetical protein
VPTEITRQKEAPVSVYSQPYLLRPGEAGPGDALSLEECMDFKEAGVLISFQELIVCVLEASDIFQLHFRNRGITREFVFLPIQIPSHSPELFLLVFASM